MNIFIINTNKQAEHRYEQEMIDEQKCAAYRSTKQVIKKIKRAIRYCYTVMIKGLLQEELPRGEL